jgi:hypothetical protein
MGKDSDLFHRKAFGNLEGGYYEGWKCAGDILRVGAATVKNCRFEWGDGNDNKFRTAKVRSYKLAPPESSSKYGAQVLQSWMWDYETIKNVANHADHIPPHHLEAMRSDPNLLVDSDDLTKDGFEAHLDEESVLCRASVFQGDVTYYIPRGVMGSESGRGVSINGCLGRVLLKADRFGGYTAIGYEHWLPNVPLARFLPAALRNSILPVSRIPPHEVDKPWPDVNEPMGGGPEFDGDTLRKHATVHAVKGYSFRRPGQQRLEYIRLCGDLYAVPLKGNRLFDRAALLRLNRSLDAVTRTELDLQDKSTWLDGGNFLLPAINGLFPLEIDPAWIVAPVLSLAPALGVDGKFAVGVSNYFNLPCCVVNTKGKLQACPPMSTTHMNMASARIFLERPAQLVSLVHDVLQRVIVDR